VETLNRAIKAFRLGIEGEASEALTQLIDQLAPITSKLPTEITPKLNLLLDEILNAFSRKDYLWAADLLEYELNEYIIE
jgi:hypothetical protein